MQADDHVDMGRRKFLGRVLAAAALPCLPGDSFLQRIGRAYKARSLSFYNIHTGEVLKAEYYGLGQYNYDAIEEINHILRDHRTGEVEQIDVGLLDLLYTLKGVMEVSDDRPYHIISGFRSVSTNRLLYQHSPGVAKGSLHTMGKAADIRLPRVELAYLREAAMGLRLGGVGYYPNSDFVHVDTGRVKFWQGT